MLAIPGVPQDDIRQYAVEPKLDGWRVNVRVDGGQVTVTTRRRRDITDAVPAIGALSELDHDIVLDGELVAAAGRAGDFYRVGPAVAARRRGLTFVAFDLLWLDGQSLLGEKYDRRRAALVELELREPAATVASWPGRTAPHLFRACEEHGVEGIVLKRSDSIYRPGQRCEHWRKIKSGSWFERHGEHRHRR
jgi:bifunctional non-homologous end joining protein LigD